MADPKLTANGVSIAAGGILTRRTPDGVEIAIIHRPKYGDWCLPKGKVEEKETIREAALREVKEETNCEAVITGFADTTSYIKDDTPKVVYFWNMTLTREHEFKKTAEIDECVWLPPERAVKKLTHEEERRVISSLFLTVQIRRGFWKALSDFISGGDIRARRLRGSVDTYAVELARRKEQQKEEGTDKKAKWLAAAEENLRAAEAALARNDIDGGWRCFHAACGMHAFAMDDDELKSTASAVKHEADKIRKWRKDAIDKILSDESAVKPQQVFEAMSLLNGHFNNVYHKIGLFRRQLTLVAFAFAIVIIAIIVMASLRYIPAIGSGGVVESDIVIGVIVFGLMGGTFSSFFSFIKTPMKSTIPDRIAAGSITTMRILVGATSALIIYVLARSSLFESIFSFRVTDDATVLFLAFAAGFSERLVKRAVGHLAESKE